MNKAKVNTNNSDVTSSGPKNPISPPARPTLEQDWAPFDDRIIAAADKSKLGPAPLMREMNRVHQVVAGLGVVLRIVASNSSLQSDPDLGGPPPLSPSSEYLLTSMAATLCEELSEKISNRAAYYTDEMEA